MEPNRNREVPEEDGEEKSNEILTEENQSHSGHGKRNWKRNFKTQEKGVGSTDVPDVREDEGRNAGNVEGSNNNDSNSTINNGRGRVFRRFKNFDRAGYTGGRERQMKERHKGADKRRGADRKRRGGMF